MFAIRAVAVELDFAKLFNILLCTTSQFLQTCRQHSDSLVLTAVFFALAFISIWKALSDPHHHTAVYFCRLKHFESYAWAKLCRVPDRIYMFRCNVFLR